LRGKVPNEILVRPKKGFGIPLNHWIKGKFGDVILEHIIGGDWSGTSLEGLKFEQFAKDIRSGDVSSAAVELLWALAVFQIWRQAWS
jgi:asparagine synthase (glutamine-hydrolysing)